jgi:hypothetical protein
VHAVSFEFAFPSLEMEIDCFLIDLEGIPPFIGSPDSVVGLPCGGATSGLREFLSFGAEQVIVNDVEVDEFVKDDVLPLVEREEWGSSRGEQ